MISKVTASPSASDLKPSPLIAEKVNKNVLATFLLDETKTFCVVKPFNFTLCHFPASFFRPVLRRNGWLPLKFLESDAGKAQSLVKHATCNVLQKLPKLAARVVYHSDKAGVKKI